MNIEMDEKPNIIIADDNEDCLFALEKALSELECPIFRAHSGEEVLNILIERKIGLVILDIHMKGLDGYETAKLIRSRNRTKHIPLIFISGAEKGSITRFRDLETAPVEYLFKPVDIDILIEKIAALLDL